MTQTHDDPVPYSDTAPRYARLDFHGPLSDARAARLVGRLARTRPATVLDLGCGWGERLRIWLRGSRGCLGLAYLTLIPMP